MNKRADRVRRIEAKRPDHQEDATLEVDPDDADVVDTIIMRWLITLLDGPAAGVG